MDLIGIKVRVKHTSSMVMVAWGLLSLLYCTTPAKLPARFSKKLAMSRSFSMESLMGVHVLSIKWFTKLKFVQDDSLIHSLELLVQAALSNHVLE